MKKSEYLSSLFVGIDVSARENVVCALNFEQDKLLQFAVPNSQTGADEIADKLSVLLSNSNFTRVIIALESTSFYGIHIANFLSSCTLLLPYNTYVYCLNPKMVANYKKSFIGMGKKDPIDAFVIADFARVGRISCEPWRGSQFLALQRLTRHRLHLVECLAREKTYMLSNVFLKFSEFAILTNKDHPFSNKYGATASAVLTDFLSNEEIAETSIEDLIDFVCEKGKNRFSNPQEVASILQAAARNSYRLDKCLYEPLTIAIASSFNCLKAFKNEIKSIDKAIIKTVHGLNPSEYLCLKSIPGIGPVFAAGILSEIGSIQAFPNHSALAKYAGIVWTENQSGDFQADDTKMSKAGNKYLRYYLIEATSSVIHHIPEYTAFYQKKFNEVKTHQHKRALALTSRKFIRLVFGLLAKNQLFVPQGVEYTPNS
ncbi:IS110 family transposase [Irregularibacter muris]|uniref:IS110 family transposase n=1 Tax=Irregularibacter muris TaxID=1796619 RepID=A0AAE3L3E8_9FIRM|nr:IS110 family transposase [Irregularibacter muris]MCR1900314.1 IS110 family transposase [Irregularibacter muris]